MVVLLECSYNLHATTTNPAKAFFNYAPSKVFNVLLVWYYPCNSPISHEQHFRTLVLKIPFNGNFQSEGMGYKKSKAANHCDMINQKLI
jgi:hypothetical protein